MDYYCHTQTLPMQQQPQPIYYQQPLPPQTQPQPQQVQYAPAPVQYQPVQQAPPVYQPQGQVVNQFPPPPPPVQYTPQPQQFQVTQQQFQPPTAPQPPVTQYYAPPAQAQYQQPQVQAQPPVQAAQPPPPPRNQPQLPNVTPAGPPVVGGSFQGETGAAAPAAASQPPPFAPVAQKDGDAPAQPEPMVLEEDPLAEFLIFPDMSAPVQKEFTINGRPKSPRPSRAPGQSRRRRSQERSPERRRKERSHSRRDEESSRTSNEQSSGYSSPGFQEVTRRQRKGKSESRPFLVDQKELPGYFRKRDNGEVEYWDEDDVLCLFRQPRSTSFNPRTLNSTLHSTGHVFITESLANPRDLPKPSPRMPFGLMSNYKMCFRPAAKCFIHDYDDQCDCLAVMLRDTFHRQAVIPIYCTRRARLSQAELEVKIPDGIDRYVENPNRTFVYSESLRTHVLAVPSPFPISVKWPSKVFKPAYASCHSRRQARLFYSLFDSRAYRDTARTYLRSPDKWQPSEHPYFREPHTGSELSYCSTDLYGLESLFRTSLVQHPCRNRETYIYICSDKYLRTPVLPSESGKFAVDDFIVQMTMPFVAQGKGSILCPICLYSPSSSSEVMMPAFFGRKAFVKHYRELHWDHSFVTGLASPTQHGSRVYQAHMVYTLCLAFLAIPGAVEDDIDEEPLADMPGVRFTSMLRKVLVAPDVPVEDIDSEEDCEKVAAEISKMRSSASSGE
jgi:hypothetical protein